MCDCVIEVFVLIILEMYSSPIRIDLIIEPNSQYIVQAC